MYELKLFYCVPFFIISHQAFKRVDLKRSSSSRADTILRPANSQSDRQSDSQSDRQ